MTTRKKDSSSSSPQSSSTTPSSSWSTMMMPSSTEDDDKEKVGVQQEQQQEQQEQEGGHHHPRRARDDDDDEDAPPPTDAAPASSFCEEEEEVEDEEDLSCRNIRDVFEKVAQWVRESSSTSSDESLVTNDQKLRLYGLYKVATCGSNNLNDDAPSPFRIEAYAKFRAWKKCSEEFKANEDAMYEYVRLVAETQNGGNNSEIGRKFVDLLRKFEEGQQKTDQQGDKTKRHGGNDDMASPECGNVGDDEEEVRTTTSSSGVRRDDDESKSAAIRGGTRTKIVESFIIRPLVPRGQLDISFDDLMYATRQTLLLSLCLGSVGNRRRQCQRLETSISDLWLSSLSTSSSSSTTVPQSTSRQPPHGNECVDSGEPRKEKQQQKQRQDAEIVVGYSVRTLFDVYLTARQFPEGSEVIMSPPINVPAILRVLRYHGLKVVAVDLPSPPIADFNAASAAPGVNPSPLIKVDTDAIEQAITDKTVAILVVHPFGTIAASDTEMAVLKQLSIQRNFDLVEDCAECFTGLGPDCYKGSRHAKLSFFSFGLIKTSTALGGGIAVVRNSTQDDDDNLAKRLKQLLNSGSMTFRRQSSWSFLFRILLCAVFRCIAKRPTAYGLIEAACRHLGLDFDSVVTSALRSFLADSSLGDDNDDTSSGGGGMRCIRRTPCPALLALLHRRLLASATGQCPSVAMRVRQCQRLTKILEKDVPFAVGHYRNVVDDDRDSQWSRSSFWLYPVLSKKPSAVTTALRRAGFDATQGSSQLRCVGAANDCPRASEFMDGIVYLPVSSQVIPDSELLLLADSFVKAEQDDCRKQRLQEEIFGSTKDFFWRFGAHIILISSLYAFSRSAYVSPALLIHFLIVVPSIIIPLSLVAISVVLRWSIAELYANSSTAFARNISMLSSRHESTHGDDGEDRAAAAAHEVLSLIPSLQIPRPDSDGEHRTIILTGATGFIGSLLLRDLLFHQKSLSIAKVLIICRSKRGRPAEDRIRRLLQTQHFTFLSKREKARLVKVLEGDVTKPNAGLGEEDLELLRQNSTISHIFHCAASVSFTMTLPEAARSNITSALHLQKLTSSLQAKDALFVHVSTAFVHGCNSGTESDALSEHFFSLGDFDPLRLYRSMLDTQFYASKAMVELGFHNTYTFSKCVCEHLLSQNIDVRTMVFRPTIVGPAIQNPHEGWAGSKPSTMVAAACLYLAYQWNLWSFGNQRVPCIPVDVVTRFMLVKALLDPSSDSTWTSSSSFGEGSSSDSSYDKIARWNSSSDSSSEGSGSFRIYNVAWDSKSHPRTGFTWLDYAVSVTQMGTVLNYFSRPTAYFGLVMVAQILPRLSLSTEQFGRLHRILVQLPFQALLKLCLHFRKDTSRLNKLAAVLDLPLLFHPFMTNAFYFQSELLAPPDALDGSRYMFGCVAAANSFMEKSKSQESADAADQARESSSGLEMLCVGGSRHRAGIPDAWWALTQPRGNCFVRLAGWFLVKLFRATCSEITFDSKSLAAAASLAESKGGVVRVVLAPTHRSFYDFLVVSFVLFSVPELQLDLPFIAAADDFEKLPIIGFLAKMAGAFFVRRGRKQKDPRLRESLKALSINQTGLRAQGRVFEVFVEGSRSRDRRFLKPRTGLLRCLKDYDATLVVVPVAVNYERLPEQSILSSEARGGRSSTMSLGGLISWLFMATKGKVSLGRVHVAACDPVISESSENDMFALTQTIQQRQVGQVHVSNYHIEALSRLLSVDPGIIHQGISNLGCRMWPSSMCVPSMTLEPPSDKSELATVCLQASPFLARMVRDSRPEWASWLCQMSGETAANAELLQDACVGLMSKKFAELLDAADSRTERALRLLKANGFSNPKPEHVFQTALDQGDNFSSLPRLLQYASVSIRLRRDGALDVNFEPTGKGSRRGDHFGTIDHSMSRTVLDDSGEALGFWGFHDSSFIVKMDNRGAPYVTMQGSRYPLCDKRVLSLLPFIEDQTQSSINLLNEAFEESQATAFDDVVPSCRLSAEDIELIKSCVGSVSDSVDDRVRHGTGHCQEDVFSIRSKKSFRVPDAVVWPTSEARVAELVRLAKARAWCLIPFGGGTNVSQATRCPSGETRPILSVDMKKMDRIFRIDEENGLAHVEAGITGRALVARLAARGYTMGHEPDSYEFSTLGGWIATKASGMKRARYGNIEDIVKGVRAVGAGGEILHHGDRKSQKEEDDDNDRREVVYWGRECTGLELRDLMFGSEGCLGIVTSAAIRVWPLPDVQDHDGILLSDFDTGLAFVRDVSRLGGAGMIPASVRLLDNEHFRLGQALAPEPNSAWESCIRATTMMLLKAKTAATMTDIDLSRAVIVTIAYEGSREEVRAQKLSMAKISNRHGGISLGSRAGRSGYDLTFVIAYLRDFALTYRLVGESFETFVPWSKVGTVVAAVKRRIRQEHADRHLPGKPFVGCRVTQLYHEGACLYFYLCMNFDGVDNNSDPSEVFAEIEAAARDEILNLGGSLSHHHGVGKVRSRFLSRVRSPALVKALKAAKAGIDPDNIFGARNGVFAEIDGEDEDHGSGDD